MDFTTLRLIGNTASSSASDGKAIGTSEKFYRLFSMAAGNFFCKTLRPVIQHLRQLGLRLVIYVDDIYISLYYLWLPQRRLRITSSFSWIR